MLKKIHDEKAPPLQQRAGASLLRAPGFQQLAERNVRGLRGAFQRAGVRGHPIQAAEEIDGDPMLVELKYGESTNMPINQIHDKDGFVRHNIKSHEAEDTGYQKLLS